MPGAFSRKSKPFDGRPGHPGTQGAGVNESHRHPRLLPHKVPRPRCLRPTRSTCRSTYCSGTAALEKELPELTSLVVPPNLDPHPLYGVAVLSTKPEALRVALFLLSEKGSGDHRQRRPGPARGRCRRPRKERPSRSEGLRLLDDRDFPHRRHAGGAELELGNLAVGSRGPDSSAGLRRLRHSRTA